MARASPIVAPRRRSSPSTVEALRNNALSMFDRSAKIVPAIEHA
jgi:hypothetical protein